jgi:hypothetical protein
MVPSMTLQGVSHTAYALGQLGLLQCRRLLLLLLQHGVRQVQALGAGAAATQEQQQRVAQVLAMLCWSAAVLGVTEQRALLAVLAQQCARHWPHFTREGLSQVHMLHLALQLPPSDGQQQQQQQPQQLAVFGRPEAAAAFRRMRDTGGSSSSSSSTGTLQRKVFAAAQQLRGLQGAPQYEALTDDGAFSMDIMAVHVSGARLAIEVDGPAHFSACPGHQRTGTTLFRDAQLAARGYTVLPVAFFEWNAAVAAGAAAAGAAKGGSRGRGGGGGSRGRAAAEAEAAEAAAGVPYLQARVDAAVAQAAGTALRGAPAAAAATAAVADSAAAARAAAATAAVADNAAAARAAEAPEAASRRRRRRALTT